MHILSETEYKEKAEPILNKVFTGNDEDRSPLYGKPFNSNITSRVIVYPCHSEISEAISLEGLVKAAEKEGDEGIYILPSLFAPDNYCYVPLSEFVDGYAGISALSPSIYEAGADILDDQCIFYGSNGTWGLITEFESLGILGGTPQFIEEIRSSTPNLDLQVYGFLARLRGLLETAGLGTDPSHNQWLFGLLTHVYGEEKAHNLIQEVKNMSSEEAYKDW